MSINVGLFIAWSLQFQYNSSIIGSFSEFFGGRLFLFNCSRTVFVNWKKEINTGFKTSKETLTFSFFSYVVSVIKLGGCLVKAEVLRQCSCSLWSFDHKAVKSKKTKMQINWSPLCNNMRNVTKLRECLQVKTRSGAKKHFMLTKYTCHSSLAKNVYACAAT